jgi:drug/metabolite transporter (DMT)-like permease
MKPPTQPWARPHVLAHVLLVAVALVWGATFPLVKSALQDVSPLLFNLLRMTLAFVALAVLNRHALRRFTRRELGFGALAGFFLGLGYQFQTAGLARTSASKSAFITGLTVVLVPLFSAVPGVRRASAKRPHAAVFAGAALAFLGLLLLTTVRGAPLLSGFGLGETLTLICAFAFAAHLLTLAHAAPLVDASRLATLQIGFAALFMLFISPLEHHMFLHVTVRVVTALLVTAILATAAAFTIQSYAQQLLPASHVALIFTLEPVFAWLTAMLLLHEKMGARAIAGALTILTGILLAELYPAPVARPLAAEALTLDP